MLPFWLRTVRTHLGAPGKTCILSITDGDALVGLAPLALDEDRAHFLGTPDVCDYQDIVCRPGRQTDVMKAVLDYLAEIRVRRLDLRTVRPEAAALGALKQLAENGGLDLRIEEDDVTFETGLPATWDDYLMQLNGKQRHEVRRKVRRLENNGAVRFTMADGNGHNGSAEKAADTFVRLFRRNRQDKADFMNPAMEGYFRDLIDALNRHDLLRLYTLDIENNPTAAVLCFDYKGVRYLYNSGYDERYQDLSVGVLCKLFSIRGGIEMGCRHYDFLRGAEIYKKRIGGRQTQLYRCLATL